MSLPETYHSNEPPASDSLEARLAPVMFVLAFLHLLIVAGMIHRAPTLPRAGDEVAANAKITREPTPEEERITLEKDPLELRVMEWGLLFLHPIFLTEAIIAFLRRHPSVSRRLGLQRVLLVLLFPPFRLAWIHPATARIWLPRLGWHPPGKSLLKVLDKLFTIPMVVFALLILPVLAIEVYQPQRLKSYPGLELALDVSTAVIWLAFAIEFILKVSASPKTLGYIKTRWLDLAIVLLPTLEFLLTRWVDASPLLRLLRIGRAIGPQQISPLTKMYRLRGVMMKGWQAFLLLESVARLTGNTPDKRLRKIELEIEDLETQLAELHEEAVRLRKIIGINSSESIEQAEEEKSGERIAR